MKVAYVINSLEGGGAALPVPAVIDLLRRHGMEVRLLALARRDGRAQAALDAAGIDHRVAPDGGQAATAAWLWREVRACRPDAIWTSLTRATIFGQLVGAACRTPVVSWQHNAFLKRGNAALLRTTRGLTRLWVADSEAVAHLTARRLGVDPARILVWPLMIAHPPATPPRLLRPGERFRIGSLGRLHPNKGYDVLVRALGILGRAEPDLLRTFEVVVGGEGAERAALEAAAGREGVSNLVLAGFQPHAAAFLGACHGYIQPSRAEGLCIAAHEAMQAGLPVIVTAVGEMPATVEQGRGGFVAPPGDDRALAEAIRAMVRDPEGAARMGRSAQARVLDRFSPARFEEAGAAVVRRLQALIGR